ncbi:MAG: hypothetical protein AAFV29_14390, partial [Myxococcota bacterium]
MAPAPVTPAANDVAVLPFVYSGQRPEVHQLVDGMTGDVIRHLRGRDDLKVVARRSTFALKGRELSPQQASSKLNARLIVGGRIRVEDDMVNVDVVLYDGRTGRTKWAQSFVRPEKKASLLPLKIAHDVGRYLKPSSDSDAAAWSKLSAVEKPEAYQAFLVGSYHLGQLSSKGINQAIEHLNRAVALDPLFAAAYDKLAHAYLLSGYYTNRTHKEAIDLAGPHLKVAERLAPELAEVKATAGLMAHMDGRYAEADVLFEDATRRQPNLIRAYTAWGLNLVFQNRLNEANVVYLKAISVDPLNASLNLNIGALFMLMGRFEEGLGFLKKAKLLGHSSADALLVRWTMEYGRIADALKMVHSNSVKFRANVYLYDSVIDSLISLGLWDEARKWWQRSQMLVQDRRITLLLGRRLLVYSNAWDEFHRLVALQLKSVEARADGTYSKMDRYRLELASESAMIRGEYEEAYRFLLKSSGGEGIDQKLSSEEPSTYLAWARIYGHLGQPQKRQQLLQKLDDFVAHSISVGKASPRLFFLKARVK